MPQLTGYAHLALAQFSLQHCLTDLPGKGVKRALPTAEGERLWRGRVQQPRTSCVGRASCWAIPILRCVACVGL